jgi:hypothetical protein
MCAAKVVDETTPQNEYERRITLRRAEATSHMQQFRNVGFIRLALIAIELVLIWRVFNGLSPWLLVIPAAIFFLLGSVQARISESRRRCERAVVFYEQGLARLDDCWIGTGSSGSRFSDAAHPYAEDLDLFGNGSLFELLSTARTYVGEETLARWLLAPAEIEVVRARQEAIVELRLKLDLREDLVLLGEGVPSGQTAQGLARWGAEQPWSIPAYTRPLAIAFAFLAILTLVLWFFGFSGIYFVLALAIGQTLAFSFRNRVAHVISGVDGPGRNLSLLSQMLERLEREQFSSPHLIELRRALDVDGLSPSSQIARLNRLIELLDSRRNMMFAPFAALLLWPLQCAISIERWRQHSGPAVERWLAALGEFEALNSFSSYSYEHPEDPFPELVKNRTVFEGRALGHPLIPAVRNVRSDLVLSDEPSVLIVSGSNMSGKSTLLRTVGINTVLALAGGPVRAHSLIISPLQVGASIRIQDSLQAGASRFYAEITRLRQIVELTRGPVPVIFLLDEILHGTNSHDRQIGAEGVVRGLLERGAIGLITTHDLALARIAEELSPRGANVHFEDHLENGQMKFDYQLREGVVKRSNALELMRSIGLEV